MILLEYCNQRFNHCDSSVFAMNVNNIELNQIIGINNTIGLGLWCLTPLSTILWRSILLVEKTGVPRENHRPAASH